jgi:hypothetical protein
MCEVAEILSRANTATHARSAFERVLSVAEPGPIRRRALLGLGRLLSADPRHHATADSHLRELLTLNPDTDNREEAERLLTDMRRRTAEPSHPMSTSSLTRELEARARGELSDHPLDETPIPPASRTTPLQPAYVPEPAPTRSPERFAPPSPSPYAPPEGLPPPRPIYIPPETIGEANVEPTHAVILTGHQRIDVPRVAQIIGRATKQAMVQASRQIAQGMGVVFLTADPLVARQVASLLNGNRLTAAVVELDAVPRNWEESRLFSASVRNDQVTLGLDDEGAESLWINDLLAIAHGVVALEPNDPNPPLVADLLTKSGRRLRALESQFQHATPGEPETLSSFMVHLAARAPRVMRDAALDNVIRANRHSCMRFDSVEAFEAYEKWLTFSAIAASR